MLHQKPLPLEPSIRAPSASPLSATEVVLGAGKQRRLLAEKSYPPSYIRQMWLDEKKDGGGEKRLSHALPPLSRLFRTYSGLLYCDAVIYAELFVRTGEKSVALVWCGACKRDASVTCSTYDSSVVLRPEGGARIIRSHLLSGERELFMAEFIVQPVIDADMTV